MSVKAGQAHRFPATGGNSARSAAAGEGTEAEAEVRGTGPTGERGRTCNGTVSYAKAVRRGQNGQPAGSLAYIPVRPEPGCDLDVGLDRLAVALGDGDLCIR